MFGEGPLGLEDIVGAAVFLDGAEGLTVGAGEDFGDGFLNGRGGEGGPGADGGGAGQGKGGDLAGVGEGARGGEIHLAGEDAVGDLGEEELDGGVVLKERDGDFGAFLRALGMAEVFVGEAMVVAAEGGGVALEAVDAESAAAAVFFGLIGRGGGLRSRRGFGEHTGSFQSGKAGGKKEKPHREGEAFSFFLSKFRIPSYENKRAKKDGGI